MTVLARVYRDEAVVLRTWKLGEADRIVSLHTHGGGKVRCVAKGVRRTRSKFGGRLEPASHVAVQIYRGRGDLSTVTQTETITCFSNLWADPDRFIWACAMLEAVDRLSLDGEPNAELHVMLIRALATLDRLSSPLVLAGFFLKLLVLEGVKPVLDYCVMCNATQRLEFIDVSEGGVICVDCGNNGSYVRNDGSQDRSDSARAWLVSQNHVMLHVKSHKILLKPKALHLLRMIFEGRLAAALRHPVDVVAKDVTSIASHAMEMHIERHLRSIKVMKS